MASRFGMIHGLRPATALACIVPHYMTRRSPWNWSIRWRRKKRLGAQLSALFDEYYRPFIEPLRVFRAEIVRLDGLDLLACTYGVFGYQMQVGLFSKIDERPRIAQELVHGLDESFG